MSLVKRFLTPLAFIWPCAAEMSSQAYALTASSGTPSAMAWQDKTPAVGSRQMDVDHLDG